MYVLFDSESIAKAFVGPETHCLCGLFSRLGFALGCAVMACVVSTCLFCAVQSVHGSAAFMSTLPSAHDASLAILSGTRRNYPVRASRHDCTHAGSAWRACTPAQGTTNMSLWRVHGVIRSITSVVTGINNQGNLLLPLSPHLRLTDIYHGRIY